LSELTNRPKYGGAQSSSGSTAVTANDTTILTNVSGKGMTYGAFIALDHDASQKNSIPQLIIDGQVMSSTKFYSMWLYNIGYAGSFPIVLNWYDDTDFVYCVTVSYGLTFETNVALRYYEDHGDTPTVHYRLVYALI